MLKNISKYQIATTVAVLFHLIGLCGLLFTKSSFFIESTGFNLALMFILLLWTQPGKNKGFYLFCAFCMVSGFLAEVIGVNIGYLFGNYTYGQVMGPSIFEVPLIIGVNWFIIIFCCGISIQMLMDKLSNSGAGFVNSPKALRSVAIVTDAATLAVVFDWLMEPVAVKLGYWQWLGSGDIPFYNYLCWFLVSVVMLIVFKATNFPKKNKFAVNLLMIQFMFFLLLRTFLK